MNLNDQEIQRRNRNFRNIALVIIVVIFAVILLQSFFGSPDTGEERIAYSDFLALVEAGQVPTATISGSVIRGTVRPIDANPALLEIEQQITKLAQQRRQLELFARKIAWLEALQSEAPVAQRLELARRHLRGLQIRYGNVDRALAELTAQRLAKRRELEEQAKLLKDARRFRTEIPPFGGERLHALLQQHNVRVSVETPSDPSWFFSLLFSLGLPLVLILLWLGMMRRMQGESSSALNFGRSQAKLVTKEYSQITFNDVAGIDEVKEEVQEIVDYLKDPQKFTEIGAQIPKGVLLVGPPGTGKTLLARAIAGEADVPFFSISGSDFVEMFVGVGAARVRDLFRKAKEEGKGKRGVIIFIDEIDAVGRKRGAGIGGGHDEREQTLNQLLAEMDGFDKNEHVIIVAATNRPDILDPALLRPGRFDRKITVPPPDAKGREAILKVHVRNKKLAPDVSLSVLARRTPGFVGADLENLCNEAALLAARRNKSFIEMKDFEDAIDRVIAGIERKGRLLSEEEKVKIAYHEAGHALLGKLLPKADPVHRISIVPRGEALGYTLQLPLNDKYLFTKEELLDRITGILGGRAAEEIVFHEISTGAYDDLKKATEIAKRMVVSYGMSERVGPINLGRENGNVFLGVDLVLNREHSERMLALADEEIKTIIESCYRRAKELLQKNLSALQKLAKRLLEVEVLEGEQLDALLKDSLVRPEPAPQMA
ncbi:MAG: ATP-dependent zinc metalloprotease FtsH [Candidatus Bipolaricaulota bacterium]|nr:ATP-dependent zinc metalloprotease FtsH [Candidatus Bipolaricaulota bacterium]MCS7273955.1 ATP-dependent zinc metalloprotease FtsH [Candidatus Bipolaricaulota bacterium]MDW8111021.1 ATP-dependent zinc metalloprotease FtsH [Candidatus Bipolaricaulota bacterium]MDW8329280.1 ATP-dependent zinc metalloprotease FtsH [Candidatus Bipolaricaulota bacterium]